MVVMSSLNVSIECNCVHWFCWRDINWGKFQTTFSNWITEHTYSKNTYTFAWFGIDTNVLGFTYSSLRLKMVDHFQTELFIQNCCSLNKDEALSFCQSTNLIISSSLLFPLLCLALGPNITLTNIYRHVILIISDNRE